MENKTSNEQGTANDGNTMLGAVAKDKLIKICKQVAADMENNAKEFDGKPFDGKTVATYFGYQGAAIKALADIVKQLVVESHCA